MYRITVQHVNKHSFAPKMVQLRQWTKQILENIPAQALEKQKPHNRKNSVFEVTLRIVDKEEMSILNARFRYKQGPTNVLSFPCELPTGIKLKTLPLGDIVICADIVNQEAQVQQKSTDAHWVHMLVHGILHLLGFDHATTHDAEIMESEEIRILTLMGFPNP